MTTTIINLLFSVLLINACILMSIFSLHAWEDLQARRENRQEQPNDKNTEQ